MSEITTGDRIIALSQHLGCEPDDISEGYDETTFEHGSAEYKVMTDDEADQAWDEYLQSYIDDCLEIPDAILPYFDEEKWKRDAKFDGRGHSLSGYDGNEHEYRLADGTYLYIYRTN